MIYNFLMIVATTIISTICLYGDVVDVYPLALERLIYYKENSFRVFYGGPVEHHEGGIQWLMLAAFDDEQHHTRAVYEIAFVNCNMTSAKKVPILFTRVLDIDIKPTFRTNK